MKFTKKTLVLACFAACTAGSAMALENVENSLQYAYGFEAGKDDKNLGYGSAGNRIETFRFQHESDSSVGSNFFLYDIIKSDKVLGGPVFGTNKKEYFFVAGTELHASKVLGWEKGTGLIKDWGLSTRYENGSYYDFSAIEVGPQVHLNVPGFDTFKLTWWQRWKKDNGGNCNATGPGYSSNCVGGRYSDYQGATTDYPQHSLLGLDWKTKWEMWGKKWTSQAFVRYQIKQNNGKSKLGENVSGIPERLWIEPDIFMHIDNNLSVGARIYYQRDSNSVKMNSTTYALEDKSYLTPQIVVKYNF